MLEQIEEDLSAYAQCPKNFDWNSYPFLSKKHVLVQFCLKDGKVTLSDLFPTSIRYRSNVYCATVVAGVLELLGAALHMPPMQLIFSFAIFILEISLFPSLLLQNRTLVSHSQITQI